VDPFIISYLEYGHFWTIERSRPYDGLVISRFSNHLTRRDPTPPPQTVTYSKDNIGDSPWSRVLVTGNFTDYIKTWTIFLRRFMNDAFPFWRRVRSPLCLPEMRNAMAGYHGKQYRWSFALDFLGARIARPERESIFRMAVPATRSRLGDRCRFSKLARKWNASESPESDADGDARRSKVDISANSGFKKILTPLPFSLPWSELKFH